ncbi:hypothetical protein [Streptomyces avermitilis]|uniref:hypothetical protein n=1 Tax=Streptomyces avermitilis TaxID=33903 RepID=UPI0037FE3B3C
MGIFSKRPHPDEDQHIEEGKRRGSQLRREMYARLDAGTATREDKRRLNAGRKRADRIK